jgi:hypothetical protein
MARASVYTHIPLDRAAQILGIDPLHFNSVVSAIRPEESACDDLWFQYPSQREGQASREDLALALRTAEDRTFFYLGYPLVPTWFQSEEHMLPRPYATELAAVGWNSRGSLKSIRSDFTQVIEAGIRAKTLVQANNTITYTDVDGDGYPEEAEITLATTVTIGQELHVYYPGEGGSDFWEVRPVTVTLSGGNAVITFRREQVANKDLLERYASPFNPTLVVDGDDDANFLTLVDVYRVYNDPSTQGVMYAEDSCTDGVTSDTAQLTVRNGKLGIFAYQHRAWDATTSSWVAPTATLVEPFRMLISYRAGLINYNLPRPLLDMEPRWERAIVYYASSLLDREVSGCENTHNIWAKMTEDLAKTDGGKSFSLGFDDLRSPLGTTRAGLDLWRMIKRERVASR